MSKEIIMAETTVVSEAMPKTESLPTGQQAVAAAESILAENRLGNQPPGPAAAPRGLSDEELDRYMGGGGAGGGAAGGGGRERGRGIGGGRGDDEGGSPGEPEIPQPPEGFPGFTLEQLWSPEFSAERYRVANELKRMEGKRYKEAYGNADNRAYLGKLYRQWKYLEALDTKKSHESKPFDPADLGEDLSTVSERVTYGHQNLADISKIDDQPPTVRGWSEKYRELLESPITQDPREVSTREANINNARDYLSRYFKEAHNVGILDAVDAELNSIAREIQHGLDQGLSPGEIMRGKQESYSRGTEGTTGVDNRVQVAKELGQSAFSIAKRTNPNIVVLEGVWDVYVNAAMERLTQQLNPYLTPTVPIEGGFRFEAEREGEQGAALTRLLEEEGETYWRPTYANYFTIYARNREQFNRAKETFTRWVRTGLGKDPQELFATVDGFNKALTTAGQRASREMQEYTVGVKLELEGIVGFIDANLFNELFNPEAFQKSWEFIAKTPEGNARMLKLIQTSRGVMAAVLKKLATDPELELLHSPHGSRGQLDGAEADRNAIEMRSLQDQILRILTVEAVGVSLKEYHPDDPEKRIDSRGKMYQRNLDEILKFRSDEYFENLYEGFDLQEQDRLYYELRRITELKPAENKALQRLERARRVQNHLREGHDPAELRGEERIMYEEANNAVTLAWEVFGAMGEKAQRGGTVYLVDRKDAEGKPFRDFIVDFWVRRALHLVENWNKATYGGVIDQDTQTKLRAQGWIHLNSTGLFAAELFYKVGQARRFAIWQMKADGKDAKFWDFTLLRGGKPVDINTLGYTQYGENLDADNDVDRYRYAAPVNERFMGYNTRGDRIALVFSDDGKPMTLEYDAQGLTTGTKIPFEYDSQGNAVIYDQPVKTQEWSEQEKKLVWILVPQQDRKRILFDNLNINAKAEPLKMKVPKGSIHPKTGKMIVQNVDEVHVDFDSVMYGLPDDPSYFSSHPYALFEGSPYPGYQEEWTGLLLHPDTRAEAKEIKVGRLRPQDALPHAVHLLMVDPTLQRVGHFDIVSLEPVVVLAAQEESYYSEWRIGDELFMNFYPEANNMSRELNRTEFVLQDHGGSTKQWYHSRAEAALWRDSRARRLNPFLPYVGVDFGSFAKMAGAPGGPLDVFRMMAYAKYKLVGQFFMDKWNNQLHAAQKVLEASTVDAYNPQAEKIEESLGRKLNTEADTNFKKHSKLIIKTIELGQIPEEDDYQAFLVSGREALGRVERYMHRNTVLQSVFRGERAPLLLEGTEVYKRRADGSFELDSKGHRILNPKVDTNSDSGSSRHRNNLFIYRYARATGSRAYAAMYPDTYKYFTLFSRPLADYPRLVAEEAFIGRQARHITGWDWANGKANN